MWVCSLVREDMILVKQSMYAACIGVCIPCTCVDIYMHMYISECALHEYACVCILSVCLCSVCVYVCVVCVCVCVCVCHACMELFHFPQHWLQSLLIAILNN